MMITLTIAIPTAGSRAPKLLRLLKTIDAEARVSSNIEEQIQVLVSDNALSDDAPVAVSEFLKTRKTKFKFNYFRQPRNLGFDGNISFLYGQAETDYVWFVADDDVPLPGSVSTILQALEENHPDALLFSFVQPPGSKVRTFNYSHAVEVVTAASEMIKLVHKYPKISIYVLRKVAFDPAQLKALDAFFGNEFYFIGLTYSVLGVSREPRLCLISEPLATCDEDYVKFSFDPKTLREMYKIFYHPFVLEHLPDYAEGMRTTSYCGMIQFLFAVKVGSLIVNDLDYSYGCGDLMIYDKAIKNTEFCLAALFKRPRSLVQLAVLKMGLTPLYLKVRPAINAVRKILPKQAV